MLSSPTLHLYKVCWLIQMIFIQKRITQKNQKMLSSPTLHLYKVCWLILMIPIQIIIQNQKNHNITNAQLTDSPSL